MATYRYKPGSKTYDWLKGRAVGADFNEAFIVELAARSLTDGGVAGQVRVLNTLAEIVGGGDMGNTLGATILLDQTRKLTDNEGTGYAVRPLSEKQIAVVARDILVANRGRLGERG